MIREVAKETLETRIKLQEDLDERKKTKLDKHKNFSPKNSKKKSL
jgi:hypothetical protein